jgi:hypothetical protein
MGKELWDREKAASIRGAIRKVTSKREKNTLEVCLR